MLNPFGRAACEAEIMELGADKYSTLYFDETPFNDSAQRDETYLVVGRRGSGKTALAQAFSFAMRKSAPLCIEVRRPEDYQQVLAEISKRTSEKREIAVYELRKVWEFVIWQLIADKLPACRHLRQPVKQSDQPSGFVAELIGYVMSFYDDDTPPNESLNLVVGHTDLNAVRDCAIQAARTQPIIIALDTLEQYDLSNQALMHAIAALIEYASEFNLKHVRQNIHLKVFVSGEIFPHLKESVLLAPAKVIRDPVYMLWRPKDLLRLICWRLHCYLKTSQKLESSYIEPDWENPDEVLNKVWEPHFGNPTHKAYERLKELLADADAATYEWSSSGKSTEWAQNVQSALRRLYGAKSEQLKAFSAVQYGPIMFTSDTPDSVFERAFMEGVKSAQAIIRSAVREFEDYELQSPGGGLQSGEMLQSEAAERPSRRIFVFHGHDNEMKEAVARFLERLGFDAIILYERASGGDTIMEKVERNFDVQYAVILLSPDDIGAVNNKPGELQPRARQNVVLELGYFIGRLGRSGVCAVVNGPLEIPSDFDGVVYVPYKGEDWKIQLVKELKHRGFAIDANKAF
jgi:energy-coupling factor transporter ATP-binding protein EcfA2